jgi:hypothetical protein
MNYCSIYPCLLVRQVDQFDRLELPPNQVNMAPCQLVWQEPKFAGLKMNNLAYAFSHNPIWQSSYYAGTFGDYDMDAVRRNG